MSDISSIGHGSMGPLHHRPSINGTHQETSIPRPATDTASPADRVELSEHARWLDELQQRPAIRNDLVNQIRASIADGSYETDDKLRIAIDRLIDDLG